jgi:hypothetical protein
MVYLGVVFLLFSSMAFAIEFNSGEKQATVVELYTSEGCSSCPAADEWLSTLKSDPELFKRIIPMAFHVDYWDYLGWQDPWAKPEFSQRHRQLADKRWGIEGVAALLSQVYTPGYLVAGNEWTGWRRSNHLPAIKQGRVGVLTGELNAQILTLNYSLSGAYQLNIAYLGMGLASNVTAGENRSRHLKHDFVVLTHLKQQGQSSWKVVLPEIPEKGQQKTAISIWLTKPNSLYIEQAVASYID